MGSPEFISGPRQLRTDGVHCRESAGADPVVLKVVRITGAAVFSGITTMDGFLYASFSLHPLLRIGGVDVCETVVSIISGRNPPLL